MRRPGLAERILSLVPAASLELATFCRLAGVEESDEVATAAITLDDRPRLLVNPRFVAEHCRRDEHLFLLVVHELWHVLLAHTRLCARVTRAHNVAFDAVINAGLARRFPEPQYLEFFRRLNPPDRFPALLLRPPEGWPTHPEYPSVGPPGTDGILTRLYPPHGGLTAEPTYAEILELFEHPETQWDHGGEPVLLGDHGDDPADEYAMDDPLFGGILREVTRRWPLPPFAVGGRGAGGRETSWLTPPARPGEATQRAFGRLLRSVVGRANRWTRWVNASTPVVVDAGRGVLPNPRDRLAPARQRLGLPPTLWQQRLPARIRESTCPVRVYLDVSGSMAAVIPYLCDLLVPHVRRREIEVLQFSTVVRPLAPADLRAGRLETTFGTDGSCVWRDLLAHRGVRRALVLTDGLVGRPDTSLTQALQARGVRIHVVLPAESAWRFHVQNIAASITVLPPLLARQ